MSCILLSTFRCWDTAACTVARYGLRGIGTLVRFSAGKETLLMNKELKWAVPRLFIQWARRPTSQQLKQAGGEGSSDHD